MKLGVVVLFGMTSFLGAALLFSVQPMIGKMVLPELGGTPAVWNTCLVYFQVILLGGYLFAHGIIHTGTARRSSGGALHLSVLALVLTFGYVLQPIEITPGFVSGPATPVARHLCCLAYWRSRQLCPSCSSRRRLLYFSRAGLRSRLILARATRISCMPQAMPEAWRQLGNLSVRNRASLELGWAEPGLAVRVSTPGDFDSLLWCARSPVEPVDRG